MRCRALDATRWPHEKPLPELIRVVVAIDPATTSGEDSDETGIIVAGKERRVTDDAARWIADLIGVMVNMMAAPFRRQTGTGARGGATAGRGAPIYSYS